jgi:23S rRNA G2445 N2-methylase RlmL
LTETAKSGGTINMKFDVVVGNPPYQVDSVGGSTSSAPIYHVFMDMAYSLSDKVMLITPRASCLMLAIRQDLERKKC